MKIAILDDFQQSVQSLTCFALLQAHPVRIFTSSARGVGQLAIRLAEFDALVLIGERTYLSRALLEKLPRLKLIAQVGTAGAHIDLDAAAQHGIIVLEGEDDVYATAELTWALIMAASRKIPQYAANLTIGAWQTVSSSPPHNTLGATLRGRALGIWGYGKIGRLVARYGKVFGMSVTVWGSAASRAAAEADGLLAARSQQSFFADCDVISLHLRLNQATRAVVTAADLAQMKPTALIVNTSHAGLIAQDALLTALQQGCPGYAALDVFDAEPLPVTAPWHQMPNVLATPHIGGVETHRYEQMFRVAFEKMVAFATELPPEGT